MSINVLSIIRNLVDIFIVWAVFYYILKNIKNNVKLSLIFKGVLFIILLRLVGSLFNLVTLEVITEYLIEWGPVALIIIFQPEIRDILEQLGRNELLGRHKTLSIDERERLVYEIVNACDYMSKEKIGALITLERDSSLANYIDKSKKIYADLSSDLLVAIFYEGNPLHDGGVIIQGNRITCAGAVYPTSSSAKINRNLGTRHRAALGLSEQTDAINVVVSEETGKISVCVKGEMLYDISLDDLRMLLIDELKPKTVEQDADLREEEEIYEEEK